MEEEYPDLERIQKLVDEFKKWSFEPDKTLLSYPISQKVGTLMEEFLKKPEELSLLESLDGLLGILEEFLSEINLWKCQNIYFTLCKRVGDEMKKKKKQGDPNAKEWIDLMDKMGRHLRVKCKLTLRV